MSIVSIYSRYDYKKTTTIDCVTVFWYHMGITCKSIRTNNRLTLHNGARSCMYQCDVTSNLALRLMQLNYRLKILILIYNFKNANNFLIEFAFCENKCIIMAVRFQSTYFAGL